MKFAMVLFLCFALLGTLLVPALGKKFNPKDYEAAAQKAAEQKAQAACEQHFMNGQCKGGNGGGGWY